MQSEFEKLIGKHIDTDDYKVIEYVYTWHPVIDPVHGKQQIAELYKIGGMCVIKELVKTAKCAIRIERHIRELKDELENLQAKLDEIRMGEWRVSIEQESNEKGMEDET